MCKFLVSRKFVGICSERILVLKDIFGVGRDHDREAEDSRSQSGYIQTIYGMLGLQRNP